MSNLLLQKIVLLRVTEVGKIIRKKKRPLLLARSVVAVPRQRCPMGTQNWHSFLRPFVRHTFEVYAQVCSVPYE